MLFRLCLAMGSPYVHPDRLAEDLTPAQLDDWAEYAEVERFGGPADDYRAGLVAWAALTAGRRTKRTSTPDDYVPRWSSEPLTADEYLEKARWVYASVAPKEQTDG